MKKMRLTKQLREDARVAAREDYAAPSDDDVEVDDGARVITAGDEGVWVQAWVYVPRARFDDEYASYEDSL